MPREVMFVQFKQYTDINEFYNATYDLLMQHETQKWWNKGGGCEPLFLIMDEKLLPLKKGYGNAWRERLKMAELNTNAPGFIMRVRMAATSLRMILEPGLQLCAVSTPCAIPARYGL